MTMPPPTPNRPDATPPNNPMIAKVIHWDIFNSPLARTTVYTTSYTMSPHIITIKHRAIMNR
jgi:hypothetical protein